MQDLTIPFNELFDFPIAVLIAFLLPLDIVELFFGALSLNLDLDRDTLCIRCPGIEETNLDIPTSTPIETAILATSDFFFGFPLSLTHWIPDGTAAIAILATSVIFLMLAVGVNVSIAPETAPEITAPANPLVSLSPFSELDAICKTALHLDLLCQITFTIVHIAVFDSSIILFFYNSVKHIVDQFNRIAIHIRCFNQIAVIRCVFVPCQLSVSYTYACLVSERVISIVDD